MEDGITLETIILGIGGLWFIMVGIYIFYLEPRMYRKDWYWKWLDTYNQFKRKYLCGKH